MSFAVYHKLSGEKGLYCILYTSGFAEVTLVERNLANEEEKKERKLCKMWIYPVSYTHLIYIILNLAVGGSCVGNPNDETSFENNPYVIDYVRVYRKDSYDEDVKRPGKGSYTYICLLYTSRCV